MQAEISLCRVYKRPGVDDHPSLPRFLPTRASSSRTNSYNKQNDHNPAEQHHAIEKLQVFGDQTPQQTSQKVISNETMSANSTTEDVGTTYLGLSNQNPCIQLQCNTIYNPSSSLVMTSPNTIDDLHRLISYHQASVNQPHQLFPEHDNPQCHLNTFQLSANHVLQPAQQLQSLTLTVLPAESIPSVYSDRNVGVEFYF